MTYRKVHRLLYAEEIMMNNTPVRQPFPTEAVPQIDPFLLLHHHKGKILPGSHPRQTGVDPHPHRGFSPVTFVVKGSLHHRDSRGNSQMVKTGGVQWLDAGRGILHSERAGKDLAEKGGNLEILQLWINTPQKHKMNEPRYIALQKNDLPTLEQNQSSTQVICGKFKEIDGAVKTKIPLQILQSTLQNGANISYRIPEEFNLIVYVISGKIKLKGYGFVEGLHAILFENEGSLLELQALEQSQVLLLAAPPIKEKVVSHGPFVMNSQTEIMEAMRDYQMGKMGFLIEEF